MNIYQSSTLTFDQIPLNGTFYIVKCNKITKFKCDKIT